MLEVGRLCYKTSGRDAGQRAVVVENIDAKFVLIDGQTRRRKCSVSHLEPTEVVLAIKKGASHKDVVSAFKKIKITLKETKPKKPKDRLKKVRKSSLKEKKPKEVKPKEIKKEKKVKPKKEAKKVKKVVKKTKK